MSSRNGDNPKKKSSREHKWKCRICNHWFESEKEDEAMARRVHEALMHAHGE
jgi:hypothetical protein